MQNNEPLPAQDFESVQASIAHVTGRLSQIFQPPLLRINTSSLVISATRSVERLDHLNKLHHRILLRDEAMNLAVQALRLHAQLTLLIESK